MIDFTLAVDAPQEIQLLTSALRARLEGGGRVIEGSSGSGLVVRTDDGRVVTIQSTAGRFVLDDHLKVPWFLPVSWRSHPARATNLRIGIAGGVDQRRIRMSWRTIAELRSRGFPFESIVLGACDLSTQAKERPDEIHEILTPPEYLAALDRIDVVLECTDTFDTESFLAIAARDQGVPVVAHRDRPELSRAGNAHAAAWSADGFAEAIQEVHTDRAPSLDPAASINRFVESIGVR